MGMVALGKIHRVSSEVFGLDGTSQSWLSAVPAVLCQDRDSHLHNWVLLLARCCDGRCAANPPHSHRVEAGHLAVEDLYFDSKLANCAPVEPGCLPVPSGAACTARLTQTDDSVFQVHAIVTCAVLAADMMGKFFNSE